MIRLSSAGEFNIPSCFSGSFYHLRHMTVREETWVLHFLVPASLITDQQLSHEQAPDWTGHEKYRDSVTWTHGVSLRFFNFPTANIDKLMIEHVVTKKDYVDDLRTGKCHLMIPNAKCNEKLLCMERYTLYSMVWYLLFCSTKS